MERIFIIILMLSLPLLSYANNWNVKLKSILGVSQGFQYNIEKKVSADYTIGGSFISNKNYSSGVTDFKLQKNSIFGQYWKNGIYEQGYVFGGELSYTDVKYDSKPSIDDSGSRSGFGLTSTAGYHWQWENFNLGLQGNLSLYTFETSFEVSDSVKKDDVRIPFHNNLWLSWTMGWIF